MRRHTLFTAILINLIFCISFLFAELPEIMTTRVRNVGPGVVQKTLEAPSKPWMIYVLEVDLDNPYINIEAVDGGGLQKPSVMTNAKETSGYRLVGATNGDFYEPDGRSTNAGVVNGKITKLEKLTTVSPVYWSATSIGENNKPTISCNVFEGNIFINKNQANIDDINEGRESNEMLFYNHYKGISTGTTASGIELRIRPLNEWTVNDTMVCIMETKSTTGNMSLGTGSAVLSGDGTAATFLENNYLQGDTVKVLLMMRAFEDLSVSGVSYNYLPLVKPLKHLIGGYPMMVRNGQNYALTGYANENGGGSFATDLHPRTAVGYNQDTTKMYFIVVDGRQTSSIGINLVDLADIMVDLGVWRAMNFDGGGSSVMVIGNDVVNTPSDGVERSVRNCYAVYSSAPEGTLSMIQIELDTLKIYRKQFFEFYASGWDDNYNPKTVSNWGEVQINCDPAIGVLGGEQGNFEFTASAEGQEGYVYVDLNGVITDSMFVQPISLDPIIITPRNTLTDTSKTIHYTVHGVNQDQDTVRVPNNVFDFSIADNNIGSIDANGIFKGKSAGNTTLYVHYGSQVDSTSITVYIGEGEVSLDRMESLNGWELSGENLDTVNAHITLTDRPDGVNGSKAIQIDYSTVNSGKIYLSKEIEIPGIPQVIMLDVLSDGLNHRMYVNLEDAVGNIHTVYQSGYINNSENYETLYMDASGIDAVYPVKIKNIYIKLKTGIQQGTLYFDDLRLTYPGNTAIHYEDIETDIPGHFLLYPNYPNPFNPCTNLHYEISRDAHILLEIFNIKGELVDILVDAYQDAGAYRITWFPRSLTSGCYIYKLRVNETEEMGKMLFLK